MKEGDSIGGYTLVRRLGTGGAGTVWLAEDGGGQRVALKLLHPAQAASEAARARLVREARTVNSVRSDSVAHVLDIETDANQPFVVSEYIEGPTLAALLRSGPIAPPALAALAAHLARTIDAVHDAGIIHRDIKPSNIVCSGNGPVLIDFGIAMANEDEHLTATGLVSGTAGYTPPELLRGESASEAADWWAWCATLLSAATGRPPYGSGDVNGVVVRVLGGKADTAGIPPALADALLAGLSPDRSARPESESIVEALVAAFGLPGAAPSLDDVDWSDLADRPTVDDAPTEVRPSFEVARTKAMPTSGETETFDLARPGAVGAFFRNDSATSAVAPPNASARMQAAQPAPVAAPQAMPPAPTPQALVPGPILAPTPNPAPSVMTPTPALAPVASPIAAPLDPAWAPLPVGYAPQHATTPWLFGVFLMMPLAMIPLVAGLPGTVVGAVILLALSLVGAVFRHREKRRIKAGGVRPADLVASIAMSPLLLVRSIAALVYGLALGALVPYVLWIVYSFVAMGRGGWMTIPEIALSRTPPIGAFPLLSDPTSSAVAWGLVWMMLTLAWLMPTSVDLREGVARLSLLTVPPTWARALVGTLCAAVVVATWVIVTGALT